MAKQPKPTVNLGKKLATKSGSNARVSNVPRIARDNHSSPVIWTSRNAVDHKPSPHRKLSLIITLAQARNTLAALKHAEHLAVLPNRFVTIDWEEGGVEDSLAATGQFLKLMKDALRKRGNQTCHIWVRENGETHGQHTHLLLHVPPEEIRWFNRSRRRWLRKCGLTWRRGVWKSCAIRGANRSPSEQASEKTHVLNAMIVLRYMLKHTTSSTRDRLYLPWAPPCEVHGKRLATSQNIGRAARERCDRCQSELS